MKRLFSCLILLLLFSPCASATWADKYVTATAGGGGDGSAGSPWTLAEAIAAVATGDRVNIKAGAYANTTSSRAFTAAGTTTAPIWWRGYNTTIGDLDARDRALALPGITFTTGRFTCSGAFNIFSNLDISGAATAGGQLTFTGGNDILIRSRVANTGTDANSHAIATATNTNFHVIECYVSATTANPDAIHDTGGYLYVVGSYVTGGKSGISTTGITLVLNSIITGAGTTGIALANSQSYLIGNTITGSGIDNITCSNASNALVMYGNIIANAAGGYGYNNTSGASTLRHWSEGNDFFNNHSGNLANLTEQADYNSDLQAALHSTQESASPFKSASDFSLQYNSLALVGTFPTYFENTTILRRLSQGASQAPADGWKVISQNHQGLGLLVAGIGLLGLGIISVALRSR